MKEEQILSTDGDKVHHLTESIYRNVLDNFNPSVHKLISTGRAYQKALHTVASTAKSYIDCIYDLAHNAQICKGATTDIGAALLQIAEVHKEINTQVIDNIKSFHAELLIPIETRQENEFKQLSLIHKKYQAGHKYHNSPLDKANSALKKHRKKNKATKYGFDQKEFQLKRDVKECQQRLDDYRVQSLRQALLEERKRFSFLLERVCAIIRINASHHSKAHELSTHRLQEWTELSRNPHVLPEASESVIRSFKVEQEGLYTSVEDNQNTLDRQSSQQQQQQDNTSVTYPASRPPSVVAQRTSESDYATRGSISVINQPIQARQHVIAIHAHHGHSDTQLSFVQGDVIALIGERKDGWQYGENITSHRMGWFPIAFTQASEDGRRGFQRVQSMGNLAGLHIDTNEQQYIIDHSNAFGGSENAGTLTRSRTITDRPITSYTQNTDFHPPEKYPGSVPDISLLQQDHHQRYPPPPIMAQPQLPLPSPPPPPPPVTSSSLTHTNTIQSWITTPPPPHIVNNMVMSQQQPHNGIANSHLYNQSGPVMENPYARTQVLSSNQRGNGDYVHVNHLISQSHAHQHQPHLNSTAPSPPQSSSGYSGSMRNNGPASNSSGSHLNGNQFPPPPPNLEAPQPPTSDYEDESTRNPFVGVKLKKALTNDRSAPKLH